MYRPSAFAVDDVSVLHDVICKRVFVTIAAVRDGKVPDERIEAMLNGIVGFSLSFERLQGKFKLSQDKLPGDIAGVIERLDARGDTAGLAVAKAMRGKDT